MTKNYFKSFFFCVLLILLSCHKDDKQNKEVPECLKSTTEYILENPVKSPRATIKKYNYEGREVYLIDAHNFPDSWSSVTDLDCEVICSFGGFDGSDNDCPNFEDAEYIETIWTDPR